METIKALRHGNESNSSPSHPRIDPTGEIQSIKSVLVNFVTVKRDRKKEKETEEREREKGKVCVCI